MKQRTRLPVLSTNGRLSSNTPLGQSISNFSSSSFTHPVLRSSSCSNHVLPSRLPLKQIKPQPWQRLFEGKIKEELITNKSKPNVDTMINEDFINLLHERSVFDENSQCFFLPAPIQAHIDHLFEQIDDLTVQLSEERLKHKQTRIQAGEILSNQLQAQEKQFQELLQHKLLDHQKELKEQENKHLISLNEEQTCGLIREEKLKSELVFVKTSFHIYKINLDTENCEKLQIKINEALAAMKEELSERDEQLNKRINDARMKERKHINVRQKIEIENIRKQHQKEIDIIQKTLADTNVDLESFSKELTSTKLELNHTKERAINLSTQLKNLQIQYIETTGESSDHHIRFERKNQVNGETLRRMT